MRRFLVGRRTRCDEYLAMLRSARPSNEGISLPLPTAAAGRMIEARQGSARSHVLFGKTEVTHAGENVPC